MSTKRILAVIAVAVLIPVMAAAQQRHRQSVAPTVDPISMVDGSTFGKMAEVAKQARRVTPNASHDTSDDIFVFPIAGNTPGAFNTFFRSEATIVNQLNRNQRIGVYFFPAGSGSCSTTYYTAMTLAPYNFYVWHDFVADVFGYNGLGSLGIVAIDSQGNTDTTAAIDGTLRIYTPLPGGAPGNASQNFDSAGLSSWPGTESAFGRRHDGNVNYRTNYGIFNYLGFTRAFDVTFTGTTGLQTSTTVSVAPCSVTFQNLPGGNNYGSVLIDITPHDTNGGWYGFAASNDNQSGDSWSVPARP